MTTLLLATHEWPGHDPGWFPYFPLIPLLFVGLWVVLFVTLGRRRRWSGARGHGAAILAERYARGEIDEPEYRERRTMLRSKD
jgi:putative membrane protein